MITITIDELTECLIELNISNEDQTKIISKLNENTKEKVMQAPKIPIPFCGHIEKSWCCGVRKNHRLYTQCNKAPLPGEDYCKVCKKQADNRADGKPKFGTIMERLNKWNDKKLCYQPDGEKVEVPYHTVMTKMSITKEMAERETNRLGWGEIPEVHFTAKKKGRGRPKKKKTKIEVSDSDEDETPKKRGRKKKEKKDITTMDDASLLAMMLE
tara:strand:- start:18 stop:656 length:639 start_codon:yes stop_codon:yes gene_type:complete